MQAKGILFDLDGVFYVGTTAIRGAAAVLDWTRSRNIPHLFITNTTSRSRCAVADKLSTFGISIQAEHILTPAVAAVQWLQNNVHGPIALFIPTATHTDFLSVEQIPDQAETGASAVIIGDLGEDWNFATLNRAFRLLMEKPTPALVALGLTRYWRLDDGRLQLDAGPFVRALEYASGVPPVVLGKPAAGFYHSAADRLGIRPEELVMIGDDIYGDVKAAQHTGMQALLVKTGKFTSDDLNREILPHGILGSIADLPAWWSATQE